MLRFFHPQYLSFSSPVQLGAMQHLKDQLEQRTPNDRGEYSSATRRTKKIQEQLQPVHGQGLQVSYYI